METEDLIKLPASSGSDSGSNKDLACKFGHDIDDSRGKGDVLNGEQGELPDDETEEGELIPNEDAVCNSSHLHDSVDFTETLLVTEKLNHVSEPGENGCMSVQDEIAISYRETHGTSKSGDKRSRIIFDEQHPSVHIQYNSLPGSSKRKLEELLQHWSEWHTRHCSSSHDPNGDLEFGEKTYFPAINVGVEKASPVSFWMDNQTRKPRKDSNPQDDDSVPLYDREYALGLLSVDALSNLEGGLKIQEASRCFNCGSYNHSLKECPKPRDNNAVNSAWKQHKSKRNRTPGSHNSTRYYQSSPGGKYDGLRPGALDAETRKLLGLGELAPPPWLNRMREIGYPPGYLDPEDEDQPSGIVIFADDDENEEQEEGEVLRSNKSKRPKKMGVSFPGINAPIPENADERLWAARPSGSNTFQSRDIVASDSHSRGRSYREQRNARDSRDDGPPGCEPGHSSLTSSYQPRYGGYDSGYPSHSSRGNNPIPRSPTLARSASNRDFAATLLSFKPRFSLLRTADPTLESTVNLTALNRNVQGNQILKQIVVFCWPQSHRLSILREILGLFSQKIPAIGAVAG